MKTKITNTVFLLIALLVMTGACQSDDDANQDPAIDIPLAEIPDDPDYVSLPLVGTKWKLIGFADSETNTIKLPEPSGGDTYTLIFEEDGTVSGVTSTNQTTGTYTLDGHDLQITAWGGTKINEFLMVPYTLRL